ERQEKRAYGHRSGAGSRKGTAGGRSDDTDEWRSAIRAQRERLKELRDSGELDPATYRDLYAKAGGGEFDSVADLERYIDDNYGDR
ncbi:MAG: 50S ribosomal protein L19e, partial [Salinirussus sp.]